MQRTDSLAFRLLLALPLLLAGCGGAAPDPAAEQAAAATSTPESTEASSRSAGTPAASSSATANTAAPSLGPVETLQAMLRDIQQNRPQTVWEHLPASYRQDVNLLVRDFAQRMDPEIWQRGFESLGRLIKLLENERVQGYVLQNPQFDGNGAITRDELKAGWPHIVELLKAIHSSQLSDLEQLKSFDGGTFLAATGGALMNQLAEMSKLAPGDPFATMMREQVGATQVELVSQSGDSATVKLSLPGEGETPELVEMVRIEGRWVRREMAEGWADQIADAKTRLAALTPETIAAQKTQALSTLDSIDNALAQLESAQSAEQFNQTAASFLVMAMMAQSGGMGAMEAGGKLPAVQEPDSGAAVTITLSKPADQPQMDAAIFELIDLADNAEQATAVIKEPRRTIVLSPVRDVDSFVKKMEKAEFAKVLSVNAKDRTVTIELLSQPEKPAASTP